MTLEQIGVLERCVISYDPEEHRGFYFAKLAVDADGAGGNLWNDPDFAPDTSLHHEGKPLNANLVPYVVVPPLIISSTIGVMLGCRFRVTNSRTRVQVEAVCGDIGPHHKLGEGSVELARRLGIPDSPINGGESAHIIFYEFWDGVSAVVDGVTYTLQPSQAA